MPEILNLALVRGSPRTSVNQKKWGIFKCPFRGILLRHQQFGWAFHHEQAQGSQ